MFYDPLAATGDDPDHPRGELPRTRGSVMKGRAPRKHDEIRVEYEFAQTAAVRGKDYRRLAHGGANVALLEPDVPKAFRTSAAVNDALRSLLAVSETTRRLTTRASGRPRELRAVGPR